MRIAAAFICVALLYSCNQQLPEDRARSLIKKKLSQIMEKSAEYDAVSFGSLDSAYSRLSEDSAFFNLVGLIENWDEKYQLIKKAEAEPGTISLIADTLNDRHKRIDPARKAIDSLMVNFKPSFKGWVMTHSYRVRGLTGHKELRTYKYNFDKDVRKITGIRHISTDRKQDGTFW